MSQLRRVGQETVSPDARSDLRGAAHRRESHGLKSGTRPPGGAGRAARAGTARGRKVRKRQMNRNRSPIRVLFVSTTLADGGAERFASTCLHMLDRRQFVPRLALLRKKIAYPIPDDVPVLDLGKHRPWHIPRAVGRLARFCQTDHTDVIFSVVSVANTIVREALRWVKTPPWWIARVSGNPRHTETGIKRLWRRDAYRRADRIVANSEGLAREFVRIYPAAKGKTTILRNLTDFDRIDCSAAEPISLPSHDGPTILAVARLHRVKRFDLLLEAFRRVRCEVPARLVICGSGDLESRIKGDIRRLGLADSVEMLGFCPNPYPYMAHADLFVLCSDFEGSPNALIEAQGLGVPAVATDCPHGPREIIEHDVTGLLVPVGDVSALTGAVLGLLRNPGKRKAFGEAARSRTRDQLSQKSIGAELARVLRREQHQ